MKIFKCTISKGYETEIILVQAESEAAAKKAYEAKMLKGPGIIVKWKDVSKFDYDGDGWNCDEVKFDASGIYEIHSEYHGN